MLYAFELSGEHTEIAVAEITSCLELNGLVFSVLFLFNRCLILDICIDNNNINNNIDNNIDNSNIDNSNIDDNNRELDENTCLGIDEEIEFVLSKKIAPVLSMTHAISNVIEISEIGEKEIIETVNSVDYSKYLKPNETYVVRVSRLGDNSVLKNINIEGKIGGAVFRQGFNADLKNPDKTFRLILTDKAVFGTLVSKVDRGAFEDRAPQKKPFFYPGVLMPRFARAISNISGAGPGKNVLDPFCGTGGILIEAGLTGAKVIGSDAQQKIINGADLNLKSYDLNTGKLIKQGGKGIDYVLMTADACKLPIKSETIDAIITDPPYGRSASIKADSLHELYVLSFKEMYRVLKPGKKAVVVSEISVEEFAQASGFKVENVWKQRVHKSLTRTITLMKKELNT